MEPDRSISLPLADAFGGMAAVAKTIAQVLFFVFLVVFLAYLITGLARRHRHA